MTTILAPLDFSAVSERVAEAAVKLARAFSGRVVFLHIVQPPVINTEYGVMMENIAEIVTVSERAAGKQLAAWQKKFTATGADIEIVHRTGAPVSLILEQARASHAAYIVMGSHGHTALYDLLVGTTANGVVKGAPCPVVIVPPEHRHKSA